MNHLLRSLRRPYTTLDCRGSAVGVALLLMSLSAPSSGASMSSTATGSSKEALALIGAVVIDGTGHPPVADAVVLIEAGRIVAVGSRSTVRIPNGARRIDVAGRWIMPGMIDAHVHFFESGRIYSKPGVLNLTRYVSYDEEARWMRARVPVTLGRYLCAGVTSAISLGGPKFEYDVREAARHLAAAPNVFVAHGPLVGAKLGHEIFPLIDGDESTRFVSDSAAAVAEVERGALWQADLIKAGYLGGPFAAQEKKFFDFFPDVVAAAHARKLPVTIHVTDLDAAKHAIAGGADSLAHTVIDKPVDAQYLQAAKAHNIVVMSSLSVWRRQIEALKQNVSLTPVESRCGDPEVIQSWTAVSGLPTVPDDAVTAAATALHTAMFNVKTMHDAGIDLAVASDSGNLGLLHGASMHQELLLLAQAGVPPADIIVAATRNAARLAGKETEIGTLQAGKLADLVILSRNPLEDIRNAGAIEQVIKSGILFTEQELLPPAAPSVAPLPATQ